MTLPWGREALASYVRNGKWKGADLLVSQVRTARPIQNRRTDCNSEAIPPTTRPSPQTHVVCNAIRRISQTTVDRAAATNTIQRLRAKSRKTSVMNTRIGSSVKTKSSQKSRHLLTPRAANAQPHSMTIGGRFADTIRRTIRCQAHLVRPCGRTETLASETREVGG